MPKERATAKTPALDRRPPVPASLAARPAAVAAQTLQRRLGNQGAMALFAKSPQTTPAAPVPVSAPSGGGVKAAGQTGQAASPQAAPEAPAQSVPSVKLSPKSPKDDPAFQSVLAQTRHTQTHQKKHAEPADKKQAVADAAHLSVTDQADYNARKQHLETIDRTAVSNQDAKKRFTAAQFKTLLNEHLQTLEKNLPQTEAGAKQFKREKPLEKIKNDLSGQVTEHNHQVAAPITAETHKSEPPKSSIAPIPPKSVVEEKPGTKPAPINPAAATPKPLDDTEISLEEQSRSLDEMMAKNKMTETQLAESNEPKFIKALGSKKDAQAQAAAAPQQYRGKEKTILAKAQQNARQQGNAGYGAMFDSRGGVFKDVFDRQSHTANDDKAKQIAVKSELQRIYNGTKSAVEGIFTELSKYVDETFSNESQKAKDAFEKRVEDQLDDIHGLGIKDFFFGEDTEAIEKVFAIEKQRFLNAMDRTLDKIAERIASDLNAAVARIQQGKREADTFYQGLDQEQQKLSADAMDAFREQFANLESSVDEKQTELAHSLADSYKKDRDALRASFDKINEEVKKHWWEKAAEFLKEVATAIYRLGELLLNVLVRVAGLIGDILAHPIRFLENLGAGIKQGFADFAADFDRYLLAGFFDWLKGKVGGVGIKLPAKFDTAGLFSLALQVIGLTYENFREVAKNKLGEPVVAAIEKGMEGAEKIYELFKLAKTDIGALWEHIKDVLASLVDEIFEKIKQTVLYETIKKVLLYVATLFNPVGAFIKAAQAIYAAVRFLVDNIDRIVSLVNAFLDSVEMAVKGNVSGIAAKVIFGLQNAIVLGIDFLAKLLGLGNLADKVRAIIKQIRSPVERAMGFVVDKVVKPVVALAMKAGKAVVGKVKQGVQAVVGWWRTKKTFKTTDGETHTLLFKGEETHAVLIVRSVEMPYSEFVNRAQTGTDAKKVKAKTEAIRLAGLIDTERATPPTGSTPEEIDKSRAEKGTRVNQWLDELKTYTSILFGANIPNSYAGGVNTGVNAAGFGISMNIKPLTNQNRPSGSPPTSAINPTYADLNERRHSAGGSSYYIKGHLLNEKLGGPGGWENLTPLSREGNAQHEVRIESLVKRTVDLPAIVEYVVKPHYAARGDKATLLARISSSTDSADAKRVKSAIVVAEDWVPVSLKVEAYILDETLKRKNTVLDQSLDNPIQRNYDSYYLLSSTIPVPVNLSTDDALKIATLPGIGKVLAERIVEVREERRKKGIDRFSSYKQISQLVAGIGESRLKTLEDAGHVKLY